MLKDIENKYREFEENFSIDFNQIRWDHLSLEPNERVSVLIVEDESSFRELLKDILESTDMYKIDTAVNGDKGLKKFVKYKYDVILTDVMMDVLTGIEMAEKIIKINPKQKVFFVSSWSSRKQMFDKFEKQFLEGYFEFIDKPFDVDEFRNRIFLFINDGLSNVVFHVLDTYAIERVLHLLEPYQILVLHREILNMCIHLAKKLLGKSYTKEGISSLFLNNKDYMKSVGCTYDEVYCRGNVCMKITPKCMVQKLRKQIEVIIGLLQEIHDHYRNFELRRKL